MKTTATGETMGANDDRQLALSAYLRTVRYSSIEDLVTRFGVSVATVHRDIAALVRTGAARKVHGGAVSTLPEETPVKAPASANQRDSHFIQRLETNRAAKMLIAERAERSIVDGDIVFLDSSTTCLCLARRLQSSRLNNLSIVTNSVLIAQEFFRFPPHFIMMSLGGNFKCQLNSFLGKITLENLHRLRITRAFYSGVGLDAAGLSTYHEAHADFLREVLALSEHNTLLLDSSKFNRAGLFLICGLDEIEALISDQPPPVPLDRWHDTGASTKGAKA